MTNFPNVFLINHPLIQHKLTKMRLKTTPKVEFKALLRELTLLMGYELTRDVPLVQQRIETPLATMSAPVLAQEIVIVSVLRAGLGMSDGLSVLVPEAPEGHIGLYRDPKTLQAVKYLVKLPPLENRLVLLIDPMLATGNSAISAVDVLKERGVKDQDIRFLSLVAAPEGVLNFHAAHPNVPLYCAALDEKLNEHSYILPGLGDAGDRMFGTA